MRIAHFIQRYPPALGGSEAYFARLSRFLATEGNEVTVFTTTALDLKAFWSPRGRCLPRCASWEDGVEVRRFGLVRWPGRRWFLKPLSMIPVRRWQWLTLPCNPIAPKMWTATSRLNERFAIVHASAYPYTFPIACGLRMARRLRVPFVVTPFLHLGDPADPCDPVRRSYTAPALIALIRETDHILVQTPTERDTLIRLGIDAAKVTLQGLGVDPSECTGGDRARARRQWDVPSDALIVGHLANLSREKGTIDLLRAAQILWEQGESAWFVLAGPEMPNFAHFWKSYRPRGTVIRLGVLDDKQKRDFYAGIDAFALPSRSDSFGLVLLEAWANGVPNVAYRAGGIADVIRHGEDGLLVSCGDVATLAQELRHMVRDAAWRRKLGEAGRDRVVRDFQWEDKLQCVQDVYMRLTK